jgi:hypothetical protein
MAGNTSLGLTLFACIQSPAGTTPGSLIQNKPGASIKRSQTKPANCLQQFSITSPDFPIKLFIVLKN